MPGTVISIEEVKHKQKRANPCLLGTYFLIGEDNTQCGAEEGIEGEDTCMVAGMFKS